MVPACSHTCWLPSLVILAFLACQDRTVCGHTMKQLFPAHKLQVQLESTTGESQLQPNATTFSANGQMVAVTVRRPAHRANVDDIVALYTHPTDPKATVPVTWRKITAESPAYPKTGSGTVTFKLVNFRQNFIFRLLENGTFSPVVLAESAVMKNAIPNAPGQVHLALHADGRSIVVQWVSGSRTPQLLQYRPVTQSGLTMQNIAKDAKAIVLVSTSRTYNQGMMCGAPATTFGFITPGFLHAAVIPGGDMRHNQQLQYRVGSPEAGWSEVFAFTAPPDPAAVAEGKDSFTFLVFNDVGQENSVVFYDICPPYCPTGWAWVNYTANSTKLLKHLLREKDARLGLLVGDVSYANGVQADWDYFGHQFQPVFSRWPLAVATGNHERDSPHTGDALKDASSDSGGECNVPYTYRHYTPAWEAAGQYAHKGAEGASQTTGGNIGGGGGSVPAAALKAAAAAIIRPDRAAGQLDKLYPGAPAWQQQLQNLPEWLNPYKSYYSFSMGSVHFLMLDSESPSPPGSPQHQFAANDLKQVDRTRSPWLVACLHRQMNGPTTDPVNVQNLARLQADYEELFKQYKVDVVLQGHDHAYARSCPLYKGKCVSTKSSSRSGANTGNQTAALQLYDSPAAPIYVLAGHAGAGFTHAFPPVLPSWVDYGVQNQNGYLRVTVSGNSLRLVSISTDDGHVMDGVQIVKKGRRL